VSLETQIVTTWPLELYNRSWIERCCFATAQFEVYNDSANTWSVVNNPATTYCFISAWGGTQLVKANAADPEGANPRPGQITWLTSGAGCDDTHKPTKTFTFRLTFKR